VARLMAYRRTRGAEAAEVERAILAQKEREARHGVVDEVFEREEWRDG
jgi:hypothetical protein